MKRREFFTIVGSGFAAWPIAARAQSKSMRLVGLLLSQYEGNREANDRIVALREGPEKLGWAQDRNIRIETRYGNGSADRMRAKAIELVQLGPDLLVASVTASLAALQNATHTIPIVFAQVTDPVGSGFVSSLARPGGNITGFTQHEFSIGVKWVELLKEISPQTEHVGLIFDPQNPATTGYHLAIKAGATPGLQPSEYPVRDPADIEHAMITIAGTPKSGFAILPGPAPSVHADLVVSLTNKHQLPAVYPFHYCFPNNVRIPSKTSAARLVSSLASLSDNSAS